MLSICSSLFIRLVVNVLCRLLYHTFIRHIAKMFEHQQAHHQANFLLGIIMIICKIYKANILKLAAFSK